MPKRKAEVLADDTKANGAPLRRTRSSGVVSPEIQTTNSKPPTRSAKAASTPAPQPAKAKVTKTYGRRTRSMQPSAVLGADEETQYRTEKPQAEPAGRASKAKRKLDLEEKDAASSSSKENSRRNLKSTRGRTKVDEVELAEAEKPAEDDETEVKLPRAQKRRKVAASGIADEPAAPVLATRSRRSATAVPAPAVEPEPPVRRRGRPSKAKAPQQTPVEEVEPLPVEDTPGSPEIPAPTHRRGRPPRAKADPSSLAAVDEGQVSPEAPLSPEIAVATPRKVTGSKAGAAKVPVPAVEDEAESEDEAPPSPPEDRRCSQREPSTAVSVGKRRRSLAAAAGDGSPKKRRDTVEQNPRAESPLFSEPEEEQTDLPQMVAPTPSSPSKKRVVAVEIEPRTPRRSRTTRATADSGDETAEPPTAPVKQPVFPTTPSRRLRNGAQSVPNSPTKGGSIPLIQEHLIPCLNAQKRAALRALSNPPVSSTIGEKVKGKGKAKANEENDDYDNATAYRQLKDLLEGTIVRNEGNSCLLLGPRGSGKTRLFERCLSEISQSDSPVKPIIIRLSGWVQSNDRLALRQIAIQLAEQTGNSYLSQLNEDDEPEHGQAIAENSDGNPFLDPPGSNSNDAETAVSLPPSSQLPSLIALLPKLNRPTIVVVDAFDLFALHPRQALLYCLLDTVQACQSAQGNKGLAVVGLTSRVDVVTLFEKRVKSRFSGRILRVSNVPREEGWMKIVQNCLLSPPTLLANDEETSESDMEEWADLWKANVEKFLADTATKQMIHESYSIVRDVRALIRILTPAVVRLSPSQPFPVAALLQRAIQSQRIRTPFTSLYTLPYPALCLLIASHHSDQKGHPIFNFEMLYEAFRAQLRASMAAPIQLNGTSIGMVKCSRSVMLSAFETLIAARIFVAAAAPNLTTPKEFVKYRSVVEREDLKKAVEKAGQVSLKKWWNKS